MEILDRENVSSYFLSIIATDGGNKSSSVPINITLGDVNDNSPSFAEAVYRVNISETTQRGKVILRVTADDPDHDLLNSAIIYSYTGGDGKFYMNRDTGRY